MGDIKEFEVWGILLDVSSIMGGGYSQDFEGLSSILLIYHWLSLTISFLVGDNRESKILGVFESVLPIMGLG